MAEGPFPDSYWVHSRLLAGPYPGGENREISALLTVGVTLFIDLTEGGELPPYSPELPAGIEHLRMPIRDFSVPTPHGMERILQALDSALASGRTAYLHCRGGIGRTGTVVGCLLVRHGLTGAEALLELSRLRRTAGCAPEALETAAQRVLVRQWPQDTNPPDQSLP